MKKSILLFIFILSYSCFAQFSKTHYIPPLSSSEEESSSAQEQYLYISTPSVLPVNFKIINLGGGLINATVSKSNPYVYNIGSGTNTQLISPRSTANILVRKDKGFIIEAEDLIYVSARVIAGSSNQSGSVVSKGLAALGTEFRIGSLLNTLVEEYDKNHYTFISVLATENNTTVDLSEFKNGVSFINNPSAGNTDNQIFLNSGESFVWAVEGPTNTNRDGLIGSLVKSDKPIALNCGSFTGSNANTNLDLGFDQIVSYERTGKEYIFIKSSGQDIVEKVLLVAHKDNTKIFLNDNNSTIPNYTLNAGKYLVLDGSNFNFDGNLYVKTSENVFAYQTIGDNSRTDFANQELFFVPPLSCETPHVIDNIPLINKIGNRTYSISRITLIVEKNASLNFEINSKAYSLASLEFLPNVFVNGPTDVSGNSKYVTYSITGLTGNIGAFSSGQLYLAAYGTDDAATFGGFYSGFTFKPEVSFNTIDATKPNCIPNSKLTVNSLSPFDIFQWYFNDIEIIGATSSSYTPTKPGYYYVKATIGDCGTELKSDKIPISTCPTNSDNDLANDNIDLDNDNDGIVNCTESSGNQMVDLSDLSELNITTSGIGIPSSLPFSLNSTGDFITETAKGKNNLVSFTKTFNEPSSITLEYVTTANFGDLLNSDAEFMVNSDSDKTITVLNPDNQLLIDTNYDGIYESGIEQFSSFEIRFRLNNSGVLPAGKGTFQFKSHLLTSFKFTHSNLSDASANRSTFKLIATCAPKDTDTDGIPDYFDLDSDNDGIPDTVEAQGQNLIIVSNSDNNKDGLDDAFLNGLIPIDTDGEGIQDYIDLDSDNNGIYDLVESGSNAIDANFDGVLDGDSGSFGLNGLLNSIETTTDSGILNYTILDSNTDGIKNYIALDNDNDGCLDTIEAGFTDENKDGILGNNPPITNTTGIVLNEGGYSVLPNSNYINYAPISITTQPTVPPTCELETLSITAETSVVDSYQWQTFSNGNWIDLMDDGTYANTKTNILEIKSVLYAMNGQKYQLKLQKNGNSCGLISDDVTLTVYDLPAITALESITQCDDDSDGISIINLTQKESFIATTTNRTFTYYTTLSAAKIGDETNNAFIKNPYQFESGNATVYVRVVDNTHGCYRIAQLDILVVATQIQQSYTNAFFACDDNLDINGNDNANNDDHDGIATFDFSSVTSEISKLLPSGTSYSIQYYKNSDDAYQEFDSNGKSLEITNSSNYRNIGYPNQQKIWIRVESTTTNACFGLGFITLTVNELPKIDLNEDGEDNELICNNIPTFTVTLDAGILDGIPSNSYTYQWFLDGNKIINANSSTLEVNQEGLYSVAVLNAEGCSVTRIIKVDASDIAKIDAININDLSNNNTVEILASGNGDYIYSLDSDSNFQTSNVFTDVSSGIHLVYIKDSNGCGTVGPIEIAVLGIPKFFTPNNDGFNDTWNIKGANENFNSKTVVRIFNRYGKLLKEINPSSQGWDGTYNGKNMPSDDYWYSITLEDNRVFKGHFNLKR